MLQNIVLIGAGRQAAPRFHGHKVALGLAPHNQVWHIGERQAHALVLGFLGQRNHAALEHIKDGLREVEEFVGKRQVLADHGVLAAMLNINQARRGNGSTELGGLTLLKTELVIVIGLALVERALKAGVTTHTEWHVLGALVGHFVRHGHLFRIDRVTSNDLKRIRVLLEQLGMVGRA